MNNSLSRKSHLGLSGRLLVGAFIVLLCLFVSESIMFAPVGNGAPPFTSEGASTAIPTDVDESKEKDPCNDDSTTGHPVRLFTGNVFESEIDISVGGSGINWAHKRQYSSSLKKSDGTYNLAYIQGRGWQVENFGMFIVPADDSNYSNATIYTDAHSKQTYTNATQVGATREYTYSPPDDVDATLSHFRVSYSENGRTGTISSVSGNTLTISGTYTADNLIGCVIEVYNGSEYEVRTIIDNDTNTITVSSDTPFSSSVGSGDTYEILGQFVLTMKSEGKIYRFKDRSNLVSPYYTSCWGAKEQGLLWEVSNLEGKDYCRLESYSESTFSGGRILSVQMEDWFINYDYCTDSPNLGRVEEVEVIELEGETQASTAKGVLYTYYDTEYCASGGTASTNPGVAGDLVLVQICNDIRLSAQTNGTDTDTTFAFDGGDRTVGTDELKNCWVIMREGVNRFQIRRVTANTASEITIASVFNDDIDDDKTFWVARSVEATHYRYYGSTGNGSAYKMRSIFTPSHVEYMVANNANISCPFDLLGLTDDEDIETGVDLSEYATKSFEYHTSNTATTSVTTPWGGADENLEDHYGGSGTSAFNETGFVKSETVNGSCGGCGGGSSTGVTLEYNYLQLNNGSSTDSNVVTRLVIVDWVDSGDNPIKRVFYGCNTESRMLRKATAIGNTTTANYWCESTILGDDDSDGDDKKVVEKRPPSAHSAKVDDTDSVEQFLNPYDGSSWANDTATLNTDSTGPGYVRLYTYNADGHVEYEKIKDIAGNATYYLRKYTYGNGTTDPKHVVLSVKEYTEGTTSDTGGFTTSYTYDYYQDAGSNDILERPLTKKTTHPAVSTSANGSGASAETWEAYDESGRLRWTKDAAGYVNYYSYDSMTGNLAIVIVDVNTGSLSSDITAETWTKSYDEWEDSVPFSRSASATALELATVYEYDLQGRQIKATEPDGTETHTVYAQDVDSSGNPIELTMTFPGWISGSGYLPIYVTETDTDGKTLRSYTVKSSKAVVDSGAPTGISALSDSDYQSLTVYTYNYKGQLQYVDRYHDVTTSSPVLVDDYYRTAFAYDDQGRRQHKIEVVNLDADTYSTATNRVEKITKYDFDGLDRVTTEYQATREVAKAADYGADLSGEGAPTYYQLSATHYDESTAGSGTGGVGDGNVTSVFDYADSSIHYDTLMAYDYRGRLTRTLAPNGVLTVSTKAADEDVLGTGNGYLDYSETEIYEDISSITVDLSSSHADRRARMRRDYDQRGRVFQSTVFEVDQSDGDTYGDGDNTLTTMVSDQWYDGDGRTIKTKDQADVFNKTTYDGAGRVFAEYVCFDSTEADTDYTEACSPTADSADTVISAAAYEHDSEGRLVGRWEGTALGSSPTPSDPNNTGGNLVKAVKYWYDTTHDGNGGDRPYMTGVSALKPTTSTTSFTLTQYEYDDAGRRYVTITPDPDDSGTDYYSTKIEYSYDDLGRTLYAKTYKKDGANETLLTQSLNGYCPAGIKSRQVYEISSGSATGDYLETQYAYDGFGRMCKVTQPGGAFTTTVRNAYGRVTGTYICSAEGGDPDTVTGDTVIEQAVPSYDDVTGAVWLVTSAKRDDNGSGTGALTTDNARVTYTVSWYDDMGRTEKTVYYGTNGGTVIDDQDDDFNSGETGEPDYSADGPAVNSSNYYIVTTYEYDGFGRTKIVTNNRDIDTRYFYDEAGRKKYVVENYLSGDTYWTASPYEGPDDGIESRSTDENRITKFEYNSAGLLSKQVAVDPDADGSTADNQETLYVYAYELTDQSYHPVINGADLRAIIYSDSDDTVTSGALADNGEYDRVEFKYYADGSPRERKDQAGTTHEYVYDYIGRLTADKVTATGTGIDDAVLCIEREYDDHGRLERITSLDAATSGTVVNEVVYTFDGWGSVSKSQQDHSTSVSGSSPDVDYAYEDGNPGGAASYVRLDYVTYPGGRAVYYNYPSSGIGAALSRLDNIADDGSGTTKYAQYTYYGASSIIKIAHPAVSGGLNLDYGSGGAYTGLDRFGRVIEQKWQNDAAGTTYDQFRYGYDRNSNRTGRQNPLSLGQRPLDQYYTYDGLDRLETSSRGYLSGTYPDFTGIGSLARKEAWNLSQTGVWSDYQLDADGDGNYTDATDLDQDRTHNKANEIYNATPGDAITEGGGQSAWVDPVYDEAGNMTAGPRAGAIADGATRLFYVYDAWGRMTQAWEDDGDGTLETEGDDTLLGAYEYDGLHRRIKKTVNEVDYDYYYNTSWQILEIRKDGDTDAFKQYVWDINYIDAPICRWRDENTDGSDIEELYYTYDANFNVTALIHPQYGYRMDRFIYDAYGNVTVLDAGWTDDADQVSDVDNEILYAGYRFDPETGLYCVRMRYYHPRFGWITRDPKDQNLPGGGYHDGMSLYEYIESQPIAWSDPSGLFQINVTKTVHENKKVNLKKSELGRTNISMVDYDAVKGVCIEICIRDNQYKIIPQSIEGEIDIGMDIATAEVIDGTHAYQSIITGGTMVFKDNEKDREKERKINPQKTVRITRELVIAHETQHTEQMFRLIKVYLGELEPPPHPRGCSEKDIDKVKKNCVRELTAKAHKAIKKALKDFEQDYNSKKKKHGYYNNPYEEEARRAATIAAGRNPQFGKEEMEITEKEKAKKKKKRE